MAAGAPARRCNFDGLLLPACQPPSLVARLLGCLPPVECSGVGQDLVCCLAANFACECVCERHLHMCTVPFVCACACACVCACVCVRVYAFEFELSPS